MVDSPQTSKGLDGEEEKMSQDALLKGWLFYLGVAATIVYLAMVALMTLWPVHIDDNAAGGFLHEWLARGHAEGWLASWFSYELIEWLSNVVMFAPGGFLFCLLLPPNWRWRIPLAGICTSISIETIQHFMPGRTSSLLDVLANSLGAFLGWCLGLLLYSVKKKYSHKS